MNTNYYHSDGYWLTTDKSKMDVSAIHHFLSTEAYWSKNIPFEKVQKAVEHSLNFGLFDNEKQIGYARVITDFATIAYLGDVYVLAAYRGKGLSKWMIKIIMNYRELQGFRRWILLTGDAHGLYRQFGWQDISNPEKWMEIHNKEVYSTS